MSTVHRLPSLSSARPLLCLAEFIHNMNVLEVKDGNTRLHHFQVGDVLLSSTLEFSQLHTTLSALPASFDIYLEEPATYPVRMVFSQDTFGIDADPIINGTVHQV